MLKNLSLLTSLIMFRINHMFLSWVFSASELKIIKLEDSTSTINMSLEFLESTKREKDNQREQFTSKVSLIILFTSIVHQIKDLSPFTDLLQKIYFFFLHGSSLFLLFLYFFTFNKFMLFFLIFNFFNTL